MSARRSSSAQPHSPRRRAAARARLRVLGPVGMTAVVAFAGTVALAPGAAAQEAPSGSAANHTASLTNLDGSVSTTGAEDDPAFYAPDPGTDIAAAKPGDILKQREIQLHIAALATPVTVTQLLYRTTDTQGRPTTNVTSVLHPTAPSTGRVLAYQSFYDSLNPEDGPSRSVSGDTSVGAGIGMMESGLMLPMLQSGATVVMADTEGSQADFAAGPEYGMATLDSLRAAKAAGAGGYRADSKVAMVGYSGGAIATNWASILVGTYAPELRESIVGAAQGGVLVNPLNNLTYAIEGPAWSGVVMMAIVGLGRAYGIDLEPYLTDTGKYYAAQLQDASIVDGFGRLAGMSWGDLVRPEYPTPLSIEPIRDIVAKVNMGTAAIPDIPMLLVQGSGGELEGTPAGGANTGPGDGVMVAGDVRALAHRYCDAGTPVVYREYPLSHVLTAVPYAAEAVGWVNDRYAGVPAPNNCGTYPAGNDLTAGGQGGTFPVPISQS